MALLPPASKSTTGYRCAFQPLEGQGAVAVLRRQRCAARRRSNELSRRVAEDAAIGVATVDTPEGLSSIHHPGCAAVIWRRQPLRRLQDWIDGLDPAQLPRARSVMRLRSARDAIRYHCDLAGTPDCGERDLLIDDIAIRKPTASNDPVVGRRIL